MENTAKKAFGTAVFGGFSKADVNNYIAEAADKHSKELKSLEEKYNAASKERDELSEKLRVSEEKASRLGSVSEELEKVKTSCAEAERSLADTMGERDSAKSRLAEAEKKVLRLEGVEREYLARKTELADIEISARARASAIIADAEREAKEKREALEKELEARRAAFEEKFAKSLSEANEVIDGVSRTADALRSEVDTMELRVMRIADSAKAGIKNLVGAVSGAQDKISDIKDSISAEE